MVIPARIVARKAPDEKLKINKLEPEVKVIENEKWSLIAYYTSKNTIMDIAKHCLTATGCPSDPGAHKIGQQAFLGLNQASCWLAACPACWHLHSKQEQAVWGLRNKAKLVAQADLGCQAASCYYS